MLTPDQQPLKTITPMLCNLGLHVEEIAEIVGTYEWVIDTIMERLKASPQKIITPRPLNDYAEVIALHLHHYGCSLNTITDLLGREGFQFEQMQLMKVFGCRWLFPRTENSFKTRPEKLSGLEEDFFLNDDGACVGLRLRWIKTRLGRNCVGVFSGQE